MYSVYACVVSLLQRVSCVWKIPKSNFSGVSLESGHSLLLVYRQYMYSEEWQTIKTQSSLRICADWHETWMFAMG